MNNDTASMTNTTNNRSTPPLFSTKLEPLDIACICLAATAIIINSIVIYLFLTRQFLQRAVSNILLFSLAISDFLFSAITISLYISCRKRPSRHLCASIDYALVLFSLSTVYHILMGITDKLFAICFTIKHLLLFTRSLTVKLSLSVWAVSFIIAHVPVWWDYVFPENYEDSMARVRTYYRFHFAIGFVGPVLASAIMYTMMLHKLSGELSEKSSGTEGFRVSVGTRESRRNNERKVALIFAAMFASSLFTWGPWFVLRVRYRPGLETKEVQEFATVAKFLDPIINPLLYSFIKSDFRRALKSLGKGKARHRSSASSITYHATSTKEHITSL